MIKYKNSRLLRINNVSEIVGEHIPADLLSMTAGFHLVGSTNKLYSELMLLNENHMLYYYGDIIGFGTVRYSYIADLKKLEDSICNMLHEMDDIKYLVRHNKISKYIWGLIEDTRGAESLPKGMISFIEQNDEH
jgi:hypothetical protein